MWASLTAVQSQQDGGVEGEPPMGRLHNGTAVQGDNFGLYFLKPLSFFFGRSWTVAVNTLELTLWWRLVFVPSMSLTAFSSEQQTAISQRSPPISCGSDWPSDLNKVINDTQHWPSASSALSHLIQYQQKQEWASVLISDIQQRNFNVHTQSNTGGFIKGNVVK